MSLSNEKLPFIHYTASNAYVARTVFGCERKGLFYNYDDRIRSVDAEDAADASSYQKNSVGWWTAYLNAFHKSNDVKIEHVLSACNRSTGYQYFVFGYTYTTNGETR